MGKIGVLHGQGSSQTDFETYPAMVRMKAVIQLLSPMTRLAYKVCTSILIQDKCAVEMDHLH